VIDVILVEDNHDVREMLAMIIDGSKGFSCKHAFVDCESALQFIPNNPPDVVLMDIDLPGISGIEGIKQLKVVLPNLDIIMLTVQEDDDSVFDSLCAGASGYLLKNTDPTVLLNSIKDVISGGSPMSSSIARKVVGSFKRSFSSPLTDRETEVLKKLCEGQNHKSIAGSLFVSNHTIRMHIKNIYKKLHVHSRGEAVKKAIDERLV
jgi:DNA-binding NarL/FixJ family response regulator